MPATGMTPELTLLAWSIALTLLILVVASVGATMQVGLPKLAGNRDEAPEITGWAGRARRAHSNMLESLPLFAAAILIAQVAGQTNGMTHLGAQLFFWGRVAHAAVYIAGIAWLRTLVWGVSIVGLVLVLLQLL